MQQITFKVIGKVVDNMGESVIGATVLEPVSYTHLDVYKRQRHKYMDRCQDDEVCVCNIFYFR